MYISIITLRSKKHIKKNSTYEAYIGFRRSIITVPVSEALTKSPTVCNIVSRNNCIRIDYNLAKKPKLIICGRDV